VKCPTCGENTPDAWKPFHPGLAGRGAVERELKDGHGPFKRFVELDWMHCANPACGQLVIVMTDSFMAYDDGRPAGNTQESFPVRPRTATAGVPPEVPPDFRRDYLEAVAILNESPRMSAVLSRRILADLLERYANLTDFSLKARIEAFVADRSRPHELRANLGYLAEMGNFGAHTQTNDQAEIVDVSAEEAEWTLKMVERLFDYFIVTPARDRKMREGFDKKIEDANRRSITQPEEEDCSG
jgi:hypothetical protein